MSWRREFAGALVTLPPLSWRAVAQLAVSANDAKDITIDRRDLVVRMSREASKSWAFEGPYIVDCLPAR